MPRSLSTEEVRHVARLARLELGADEVERLRHELASVLAHIETLGRLNVDAIEPLAHPTEQTNRLAADEIGPCLSAAVALGVAPAAEPPYFAVAKVLDHDGGG